MSQDPLRYIKKDYYESKIWSDYAISAQYHFDESYKRFSENPEYLYYISHIIGGDACFLGLKVKDSFIQEMYQQAKASGYNKNIDKLDVDQPSDIAAAHSIVNDPSIQEQLATKGAAAEYILGYVVNKAQRMVQAGGQQLKEK